MVSEKSNEVNNIFKKVFGKSREYNLIDVYDYLMTEYGYISYEEFKKMDALLVDELVTRINKRRAEAAKKNKKK